MNTVVTDQDSMTKQLRKVIEIHFDQNLGTPYWLDRAQELGVSPLSEVQTVEGLQLLGEMQMNDLASRPLVDFIPRKFQHNLSDFIVGQTGGTTGDGVWTAYKKDEFNEAFISPFVVAAQHVSFPTYHNWLYIGPSGPHIIGKVTNQLAKLLNSPDPFSVDFDARWAKTLIAGSLAQTRYLDHVVEQAMSVIQSQDIGVLFTTPIVLNALTERMTVLQRNNIKGIHHGGMEMKQEELREFQTVKFPNAVHLCGYGNTLFGCCMELSVGVNRQLDYYPYSNRLIFELCENLTEPMRVTRLDESFLIVRMVERDVALQVELPEGSPKGFCSTGLRNPHTPSKLISEEKIGLY